MKEMLSSSLTFAFKFVFTGLCCTVSFFMLLMLVLDAYPQVPFFGAHIALLWILGCVFIWFVSGRLKRVELEGETLVISNYLREIRVPVRDLAAVEQNRLFSSRPVILTFQHITPFGRSILFMPQASFRLFSEDEVVGRLRSMASASREP